MSSGTVGGTLTTVAGSTVEYNGAGDQTVKAAIYTGNLTLSGSGIKTLAGVTVNGILSMEGTATASAAPTFGAAATLQYNTATPRTAGAEWITPFAATGGVIIANTGEITLNGAKVFNASVPLTINNGAVLNTDADNSYGLTFGGDFVNNGAFAANASPVTISGTMASQSIAGFITAGTVTITKTSGTATLSGVLNTGPFTLNGNGGTLNTGNSNITAAGALALPANAIITLGGSPHKLSFAASGAVAWSAGTTLTINGWAGSWDGTSGSAGKIFVGSDASGLTSGQLAQIRFFNALSSAYVPAKILPDGEIVPTEL